MYPRFLASNTVQRRYTQMRPHTQVIPRPLGCAQRSGTRAVMRSFLLPDFHPETMINYFWLPLVRGNPPSFPRIRWKSFLEQRGGRGRANRSLMSLIRAIGQFHGFSESRGTRNRLWNFLGERKRGEEWGKQGWNDRWEIVDRCIISSGERLNFSLAFLFPSLQSFSRYILFSFIPPPRENFISD